MEENRVRSTTKRGPRFFKVFFSGDSSTQLEIATAFRKHLRRLTDGSSCLLARPGGKEWRVSLTREKGGVFFRNGWAEFVRDHSLQTGEFLVFEYQGRSRFSVLVFDVSMCEKEAGPSPPPPPPPPRALQVGCARKHLSQVHADGPGRACLGCGLPGNGGHYSKPAPKKPRKRLSRFADDRPGASRTLWRSQRRPVTAAEIKSPGASRTLWRSQRRPVTAAEIKSALQAASSFRSANPSGVLVMKKKDVYEGYLLGVKRAFARQYLRDPETRKTTFWDPTGKPWAVNYLSFERWQGFSSGWRSFALANFLEQDDACVFEFIGASEIRVHIYRVVHETRPLIRIAKR